MEEDKETCLQKLDDLNLSNDFENNDDDDDSDSETEFIDLHSDSPAQCSERLSTPVEETGDASQTVVCSENQSTNCGHSVDFKSEHVGVSSPCTEQCTHTSVCASGETFQKKPFGSSTQCSDGVKKSSDTSDEEYHSADDGDNNNSHDGADDDNDDDDDKSNKKEIIDDEEYRKTIEESLSDDEKLERKERAQELKNNGNKLFREGNYDEAIVCYCESIEICPLSFTKERSIMFSNRAACKLKQENYDDAISDCSKAIELHPQYLKALLRRAELYDKKEKLDEALADFQKVVELDPSQYAARASCLKLAEQIKDRNEKMKEEMLGKLKDLGNMILRPFGMSTENFQLQQDPNSGSYSVQYKPN
ncbi:tetratricopeptide repeat protein 1-like [Gigantopelta aegis]|uniref:tetratricopeptide repeat protein 1-like n=1 Tax=Gigantopelta aegis TaxID=1735272 RepID=UPI001B88E1E8|nr:tetratricopeptide repeat protein 1-like [Gigantopelta aegis]XP_041370632.1 tetratricopeptide repeat protein 1-like [Gigantopelta aegis]